MNRMPMRRTELTAQPVGEEVILYDERRHKAFCLSREAAALWHELDGATPLEVAAERASRASGMPFAIETAWQTVTELAEQGLMVEQAEVPASALAEAPDLPLLVSRRRMLGGVGAGVTLLVPAVAAVLTPRAAEAYTCRVRVGGVCITQASQSAAHRQALNRTGN